MSIIFVLSTHYVYARLFNDTGFVYSLNSSSLSEKKNKAPGDNKIINIVRLVHCARKK